WVITDDIYSALTYDGRPFASLLHVAPDLRDRCFIVHGVAKNWGMTGYRVGFLGAPAALVRACVTLAGQSTTHTATFSQYGALAAVEAGEGVVADWLVAFDARRRRLTAGLDALDGVSCALPGGAFYVFADVRGLLGRRLGADLVADDVQLAELLLEEAHVAIVPGSAFGMPGFLRFSYAASMEALETAIARVGAFVGRLAP
ncbi:MAG: aminotransferase class I/II-fold pyridoxal phosphate-dependent enzyme, partial [Myxococcales bacterium]|nr:aminotransferase class I/II-fold pyridoxal phosphate-dependent enzyme [Myxococcales bacterium]